MSKKYLIIPLLLLPLLFLGAGCAKETATVTPPAPEAEFTGTYLSGEAGIAIVNYTFSPDKLGIEKGTKVEWTNLDDTPHRVQLDTGVGSLEMKKGSKWTFTFKEPGKYTYHCSVHPSMVGTIYVK